MDPQVLAQLMQMGYNPYANAQIGAYADMYGANQAAGASRAGSAYGYLGARDNALSNYLSSLAGAQSNLGVGRYGYLGDLAQAKYGYMGQRDAALSNLYSNYYGAVSDQVGSLTDLYSSSFGPMASYLSGYPQAAAQIASLPHQSAVGMAQAYYPSQANVTSAYYGSDADRYTTALREAGKNQRLGALGQMLGGFLGQGPGGGGGGPQFQGGGFTTNYGGSIQ